MRSRTERRSGAPTRRLLATTLAAVVAASGGACNGEETFAPGGAPPHVETLAGGYTATELAYFDDVAAAAGTPDSIRKYLTDTLITKWKGDLRVSITGQATASDTAFVDTVCAQITAAIGGPVRAYRDTTGASNVEIVVEPAGQIFNRLRGYLDRIGAAYSSLSVDASGYVTSAQIHMDGAYVGSEHRRVIRHELMHTLGLPYHSHVLPGIILYDVYNTSPEFFDVDFGVIEMLYRDEVRVGMSGAAAQQVLRTIRRRP